MQYRDAMTPSTPQEWTCSCCSETYSNYKAVLIEGDMACEDCIKKLFEDELEYEFNYPAR